jgi:hypothetical protein
MVSWSPSGRTFKNIYIFGGGGGGKQREFLNFPILRLSLQNPRIIFKKKNNFQQKKWGLWEFVVSAALTYW